MFGNDVPIIKLDEKSIMKHLWSPTPQRWGRQKMLTHSIPGVAKIPSIGMLPVQNVGGMGMPVWWSPIFLKFRSDAERWQVMHPVYMFLLKSPSRMMLLSIAFHKAICAMSCSKKIVLGEQARASPRA